MLNIHEETATNNLLEITSANQDLFMDLNAEDSETISGGVTEVFTIKNETPYNVYYYVDGTETKPEYAKPNTSSIWTTSRGGIVKFDIDSRSEYLNWKEYNLADGRIYAFRDNKSTRGNPFDIELYDIT